MQCTALIGAILCMSDCAPDRFEMFVRSLKGCVGTSAGTLIALCLLTGNSPSDMLRGWKESQGGFCIAPNFDLNLLYSEFGLDCGTNLRTIVKSTLQFCGLHDDVTLLQLHTLTMKRFVLCVTDLSHQERALLSHESYPHTRLADALFMSMTLPLLIKPMEINGNIMVDGGLMSNVPSDVFPAAQTFCLAVENTFVLKTRSDVKFSNFLYAVIRTTLAVQSSTAVYDPHGSVCVNFSSQQDMGVKMTDTEMYETEAAGYAVAMRLVVKEAVQVCGTIAFFMGGVAFGDLNSTAKMTGGESFSDESAS